MNGLGSHLAFLPSSINNLSRFFLSSATDFSTGVSIFSNSTGEHELHCLKLWRPKNSRCLGSQLSETQLEKARANRKYSKHGELTWQKVHDYRGPFMKIQIVEVAQNAGHDELALLVLKRASELILGDVLSICSLSLCLRIETRRCNGRIKRGGGSRVAGRGGATLPYCGKASSPGPLRWMASLRHRAHAWAAFCQKSLNTLCRLVAMSDFSVSTHLARQNRMLLPSWFRASSF